MWDCNAVSLNTAQGKSHLCFKHRTTQPTTKVNSIDRRLSQNQVTMKALFSNAFRMQLSEQKSSFHDAYRFRRLSALGFFIADTKNRSLVGRG